VAVGIINQLNGEFISHGVRFVVQVGDLDDKETNYSGLPQSPRLGVSTRAAAAQPLYDAGVGFWPLRGNHEGSATAALEVQSFFPQTRTVTTGGTEGTFTRTGGSTFSLGTNFTSPSVNLNGLSYSFDYNNARFVLLDQFTPTDGKASDGSTYSLGNNAISSQQPWISSVLGGKPADSHAFVFSHKQLFGGNHADTLFNSAASNAAQQNAFVASLDAAGVGYLFSGHDHMHNVSVVTSPDGDSQVRQIINASDSYKFYTPVALANHGTDTVGYNAGQISKNRELEVSQELWSIGYYIVTVDGPRVTVDFYSADPNPATPGLEDLDLSVTPALTFHKAETFGYSLNGEEFQIAPGGSYTAVSDSFGATTMRILAGSNSSITDYNGRGLTRLVDTGWVSKNNSLLASDIVTLWGMDNTGNPLNSEGLVTTNTYTLSMEYDPDLPEHLGNGGFGVAAKDSDGNWVNAVNLNLGGDKQFKKGPWKADYGLGSYGVDPKTKTAWAVINYNASFAVANGIELPPGLRK
jgi:hypothetical protein